MTRAPRQSGARPRAVEHLIQPGRRERQPAPRAFQHHEARLGRRLGGALELEILAQRGEEPAGDRHDPLPPALPSVMCTRRSPTLTSPSRRPSTSQRRNPPNSIANTIARSRRVRNAPSSRSTSPGESTRGNVRGVRTSRTPPRPRRPARRPANPRGTGLRATPASPRASRYSNRPATLDSRRAIVRAANPGSPSSIRTTRSPGAARAAPPGTRTRRPRPPPPAPWRPPRRTPSGHRQPPATCSPRPARRRTPDSHPPADAPA